MEKEIKYSLLNDLTESRLLEAAESSSRFLHELVDLPKSFNFEVAGPQLQFYNVEMTCPFKTVRSGKQLMMNHIVTSYFKC